MRSAHTEGSRGSSRLMSAFMRPAHSWQAMSGVEKYIVYGRWTVVASIPFLLAIIWVPLSVADPSYFAFFSHPLALGIAAVASLVQAVTGVIAAWKRPDFRLRQEPDTSHAFVASLVCNVFFFVAGLTLMFVLSDETVRIVAVLIAWLSLMLFALVNAPWLRFRWVLVTGGTVLTAVLVEPVFGQAFWIWALLPPMFLGTTLLLIWSISLFREADRARSLEADLKVNEERLRISQELHDTMGQHLAAMSLKTQVALALAKRGDDRLERELEELQQLTKVSASEMREVVQGFRDINLATEVAGARALLTKAGIDLEVHGGSLDVPEGQRSIAAWFVRECATNIVRHADASHAVLTLSEGHVEFVNDGAVHEDGPPSGLAVLRRRAKRTNAVMTTEHTGSRFCAALVFTAPVDASSFSRSKDPA